MFSQNGAIERSKELIYHHYKEPVNEEGEGEEGGERNFFVVLKTTVSIETVNFGCLSKSVNAVQTNMTSLLCIKGVCNHVGFFHLSDF